MVLKEWMGNHADTEHEVRASIKRAADGTDYTVFTCDCGSQFELDAVNAQGYIVRFGTRTKSVNDSALEVLREWGKVMNSLPVVDVGNGDTMKGLRLLQRTREIVGSTKTKVQYTGEDGDYHLFVNGSAINQRFTSTDDVLHFIGWDLELSDDEIEWVDADLRNLLPDGMNSKDEA